METFIQAVAIAVSIAIIILVVKWQVDDDIKKMQKRLDKVHKEINNKKKIYGMIQKMKEYAMNLVTVLGHQKKQEMQVTKLKKC